jgi:hypothetical protein
MFIRTLNNVVVETSINPSGDYHPTIAAMFFEIEGNVAAGWVLSEEAEWVAPPAPEEPEAAEPTPIPLSYIRYISLVKVAGGLSAAVATSIVDGTHASDEVNFLQRLMEKHSGDFVMSDPMVQGGLDVLLSENVITQEGRDAIEANWPAKA